MKRKISVVGAVLLCLLMLPGLSLADTLILKNGTRVPGLLVKRTSSTITFRSSRGVVRRYRASDVEDVEVSTRRQNTSASPDTSDNPDNNADNNVDNNSRSIRNRNSNRDYRNNNDPNYRNNNDPNYRNSDPNYRRSSNPNGDGRPEVLPARTQLEILTNETIDSKRASNNQTFAAQVNQDVVDSSGEVIVPKGSPAQLVIRTLNTGSGNDTPELALDIQSITVHGRRYFVTTSSNIQKKGRSGIGANKRTAEMIGGGAVIGTIIGAIAGGGKGAAIGAAVGAAGGAGAQVLTKGKEVVIPAETVIKFNLEQSVTLAPEEQQQ